jgi:hypothetical protein
MESRDRAQEAAGARWSAGTSVKKSKVATEITSGEETVTLDDFGWGVRYQDAAGSPAACRWTRPMTFRFTYVTRSFLPLPHDPTDVGLAGEDDAWCCGGLDEQFLASDSK